MKKILIITLLSLRAFTISVLAGAESSLINLSMRNTGIDIDATGVVEINLKEKISTMKLTLAKLTPGAAYIVTNGATPEAEFLADAKGSARVSFLTTPKKGTYPLDFEPRGQVLGIWTGGMNILQAIVSAQGEPMKSAVSESVEITSPSFKGKALARFVARPTGLQSFTVQLSQISGTGWSLYVDGIWRGEFVMKGSINLIEFSTKPSNPSARLLDFDPRGRTLDIVRANQIIFSGMMVAKAAEVNFATHAWLYGGIPTTGRDFDGSARVKLLVESDARRKFMLWLMDVPEGEYECIVNGVPVAIVRAVATDEGVIGTLEFSTRNDDSDEFPLTFDPATAVFTIQRAGAVYFHGRLVIASGGKDTDENLGIDKIKEDLVSTGFDSNGKGTVELEVNKNGQAAQLSIDIRRVPLGNFKVWIGGIERGTITTKVVDSYNNTSLYKKEVEGSIKFTIDSRNHPLNFDPRSQLIEVGIVGNTTVMFFSQIFAATRGPARPVISRLPLFSMGTLPKAMAKMEFKRDEQGVQSFQVSIEDAMPGNYQLMVGGRQQALIQVSATTGGSRGVIEFDDMPNPGQNLLDFDPRGTAISILQNGVVCFERTLPAGL